jgi:hypothetical protein
MVMTSDGGFAIAGRTESFGAGSADFWLVKTDEFGYMEWNKTYGGENFEFARSLIATSDGGYVLLGHTLLIKTDSYGNVEWNQTYGGTGDDFADALLQTFDGGYAIAGSIENVETGYSDFWLIKTDAYGNMEWNRTYGGTHFDFAISLVATSDEGYAMAGGTYSFGAGKQDFWLIKTDAYGNLEWNQTYGGTEQDTPCSLVVTPDGGYAIAGDTWSSGAGEDDFWLIKTDETGFVPEYSSWLLPSLLLTATLVIIIYKKNLFHFRS